MCRQWRPTLLILIANTTETAGVLGQHQMEHKQFGIINCGLSLTVYGHLSTKQAMTLMGHQNQNVPRHLPKLSGWLS